MLIPRLEADVLRKSHMDLVKTEKPLLYSRSMGWCWSGCLPRTLCTAGATARTPTASRRIVGARRTVAIKSQFSRLSAHGVTV